MEVAMKSSLKPFSGLFPAEAEVFVFTAAEEDVALATTVVSAFCLEFPFVFLPFKPLSAWVPDIHPMLSRLNNKSLLLID